MIPIANKSVQTRMRHQPDVAYVYSEKYVREHKQKENNAPSQVDYLKKRPDFEFISLYKTYHSSDKKKEA